VRPPGISEVVIGASPQAARTEGTADIHIKTGLEKDAAEFTDSDRILNRRVEDQGVCAGERRHDRGEMH
jgi:hypothetical protein